MAAGCGAWAPKLGTGVPAPGAALTGPAVSAALGAIHADGFRAGAAGGARMHSTTAGLTAAAAGYDNHESRSVAQLGALAGGI